MLNYVRAAWRFFLFLILTLCLLPVQMAWLAPVLFSGRWRKHQSPIVRLWYKMMLLILQINVTVIDPQHLHSGQKIILSNHISYIDILVIGAHFDFFFVAKSDIAGWPFFGFLAKMAGTIFITRQRQFLKKQLILLGDHLKWGQSLLIFPEGTTGNGSEILPFKSSLLNIAFTATPPPAIQPLSLVYTSLDGELLVTQERLDLVAWHGDMTLPPHFWRLFGQRKTVGRITLHPPLFITGEMNSKSVTAQVHAQVVAGFRAQSPFPRP